MNLVIDIGNTLQKCALFDSNDQIGFFEAVETISIPYLIDLFQKYKIQNAIYSSVGKIDQEIINFLNNKTHFVILNQNLPLPITIDYSNSATLGLDRIANGVGAASLFPNQNCLSIQVGTCIVYDFVNKNGIYQGGAISPGIDMRFKALQMQTQNLPLIEKEHIDILIGKDTQQSIKSGVINGVIFEIDGQIEAYHRNFEDLKVVLTGGDMFFLKNSIKNQIFAIPNLVLFGLNKILKLNV